MAFEMYLEDVDTDEIGGKDRIAAGKFHFLVESVDEEGGKNGAMRVELQVLRGTTPGQETKIFGMDFKREFDKWSQRKLAALAIAARLTTKEELDRLKAERKAPSFEWTDAVGRSICMEITADAEGQYAGLPKLHFDSIWRPDDKRASQIPLHAATLQREGIKMPSNRNPDGSLIKSEAAAADKGGKAAASKTAAKKPDTPPADLLEGVI
jgi:hypothetical protein